LVTLCTQWVFPYSVLLFILTCKFYTALVSRHPVYDLMRDYLTLSWARFSKDVQSHTLQISKILAHPAPRAGDLIKLDASPKSDGGDSNLEVIARFPGGLDFGRGLVDINFTMWPLFKCLNIDNILTICEVGCSITQEIPLLITTLDCSRTNWAYLVLF
jgi:nicotinamide N-methyltransferase